MFFTSRPLEGIETGAFQVREVGSGTLGCVFAGSPFNFSNSQSDGIFLQLVVILATHLVVDPTLLSLYCAI